MNGAKTNVKIVLVVEDEEAIAQMLEQALVFAGYTIIRAENGEEALEKVLANKPHLIVLDIGLPVVDGWEVCRRLKENPETKSIPIVVYSTFVQNEYREKINAMGANDYISKDEGVMEVLKSVKNIVGS